MSPPEQWDDDKQWPLDETSGVMEWASGDYYEGIWLNGNPKSCYLSWRARYSGYFRKGFEHGPGRYEWRDEATGRLHAEWDGVWKHGRRTDCGAYTKYAYEKCEDPTCQSPHVQVAYN